MFQVFFFIIKNNIIYIYEMPCSLKGYTKHTNLWIL